MLRMHDISKSYGGVPALREVRFDLRPGEVHVLAGENGAGKSTLIKILCGVIGDHTGSVELDGQPVRFRSPHEAAAAGITAIHQELSLIPAMSVRDNLYLARERCARAGWIRYGAQQQGAREALSQLGLDLDIRRAVESFPISVQQMIEIAKALALEARVIVMDEPTSALTEPEVERLFDTIRGLRARGCGIVYISHKMEEIERLADRITVLRDGRYIGTAEASELPRARFIQWMVGREIDERFPRHTPHLGAVRLKAEGITLPDPGGRPAPRVRDVSFMVRAGEILGLGGLQGSGASELLWTLFGAYGRRGRGRVELDGRPIRIGSPDEAIRRGVALLTNDRKTSGLVLGLSVTHNVTLASLRRFSPGLWLRRRAERACAEGLREALRIKAADLSLPVRALSGGNQQKVALAKWLATQPRVLLLDEPTRGIDVGAKYEIYQLMNEWSAAGYAIVLITSEMPELLAMSDRILVMHRGAVTAEFAAGDATQENILHAAMGYADPTNDKEAQRG